MKPSSRLMSGVFFILQVWTVTSHECINGDVNEYIYRAVNANGLCLTENFNSGNSNFKQEVAIWNISNENDTEIIISLLSNGSVICLPPSCSIEEYSATINTTSTNFTINRNLTLKYNTTIWFTNGITSNKTRFQIFVKYCNDTDIWSTLNLQDSPNNAKFGDTASLRCQIGSYTYFNRNFVSTVKTTCDETAKWRNISGIECWTVPVINLHHGGHCDYKENENITFTCSFSPDGYPKKHTKALYVDNKMVRDSITMNYTLHNAVVECRANYTAIQLEQIKSNNCTLNITYGPKFLDITSCVLSLSTKNGSSKIRLAFRFMANPLLENDPVWIERSTNASWEVFAGNSSSTAKYGREYVFEFDAENGTELQLCANYSLLSNPTCHPYNVKVFSTCDSDSQTTLIDTTTASTPYTTVIAISASVGGLAVIVTIILLCVIIKRRQSKEKSEGSEQRYVETTFNGTEKKDVVNPLYDTTDVTVKKEKEHSDSEKEEKANPIYQSMSSPISDETYAQVDKSSKKKQKQKTKGATNDAFTGDNQTALYTVVKIKEKPSTSGKNNERVSQPNSIYSEVQKDKTSKSKKEKPSKSGKGEKVELQPESMYAEVRKDNSKKPKKDDDDNEDLHGSSTKKE